MCVPYQTIREQTTPQIEEQNCGDGYHVPTRPPPQPPRRTLYHEKSRHLIPARCAPLPPELVSCEPASLLVSLLPCIALIRSTFHTQQAASSSRAVVRAAPSTQDQTEEPRRNARTGVMSMPSTSKPLLFETAARWKLSQRRPDTRDEVAPRPRGRS